jgi:hypothetical protein
MPGGVKDMKTGGLDGCGTSKKSLAGAGLNDNAIVGRVRTPSLLICDDSVLGQYLYVAVDKRGVVPNGRLPLFNVIWIKWRGSDAA